MRLLAFAVVGVLPLLTIAAPQRLQALTAFREGCSLYARQRFPEASAAFERAVAMDSAHAEAWFYLGNAYQASTNPLIKDVAGAEKQARARQAYASAIRAGLGEQRGAKELKAEALAALAESHATGPTQDAAAAIANAQQLVRELPADPRAQYVLARTYEDLAQSNEAEAAYAKLLSSHPNDPLVCDAVAEFHRRAWPWDRQVTETLPAFERCAAMTPKDPAAHYKVAAVYFEMAARNGLLEDARRSALADRGLAAADRALALQPDYQEALTFKMLLLRIKGLTTQDAGLQRRYTDEAAAVARTLRERPAVPR